MYRDMPMSQRLDRIGELLAKGVYLYMKKETKLAEEEKRKAIKGGVQELSSVVDEKNK